MGFAEVLTLIFITLKLTGYIDWSWWYVLMPEIVSLALVFIFVFVYAAYTPLSIYKRKKK